MLACDDLGLPCVPVEVALPVGIEVAVAVAIGIEGAAPSGDPGDPHRYVIRAGAGTGRMARVDHPTLELLGVSVTAPRPELRRWLHDGALLGHLLTDGTVVVDGDLMALAFVDGWLWFHRRAVAGLQRR